MKTEELISEIKAFQKEAESEWDVVQPVFQEDFNFYLGDQWDSADLKSAKERGIPALSLNYIKKNVDVLSGFQRQNRTDMKVMPVEGSDELIAEVLTTVMKWITTDQIAEHVISDAFKDALICGLGWVAPLINYDQDVLNGDIRLRKISPYKMYIDPYTTERDLSDCGYIIVKDTVSKAKLKAMFPKHAKQIEDISSIDPSNVENVNGIEQVPTIADRATKKLELIEYWRKVYNEVTFISSGDELIPTNDPEKIRIAEEDENLTVIKRKVPEIRLSQMVGGKIIVYDGENPMKTNTYPFHPIFCFYTNTAGDWQKRVMGMVRPLKDPQREKNKRRSQIMQAINTSVHSGWIMEKGAVDDVNTLRNSGGAGKILQKNPGKELAQIQPPNVPSSIIQLEMMFKDDIMTIGSNPDMLGLMQDKGAPGVTIQLRQKQGMTSMQEPFDNLSFATRMIGKQILGIITKEWSVEKFKRILGDDLPFDAEKKIIEEQMQLLQQQMGEAPEPNINPLPDPRDEEQLQMAQQQVMQDEDSMAGFEQMQMAQQQQQEDLVKEMQEVLKAEQEFWEKFEKVKADARFDCIVEESASAPSTRMANFMLLNEMGRNGTPVPPEVLIELSDIPEQTKEQIISYIEAQNQSQQMQNQQPK